MPFYESLIEFQIVYCRVTVVLFKSRIDFIDFHRVDNENRKKTIVLIQMSIFSLNFN